MRLVLVCIYLATVMTSPNLNNLVVPPVQSMRPVVDPLSLVHPSVPLPSGHID